MKKNILLLFSTLVFIVSCRTSAQQQSFTIGKGGGFTGKYDEYLVKNTGKIYKISKINAPEFVRKISKKQTSEIFKLFNKLNIMGTDFSHPGNMNYFIRYEVDGKNYEIKWGDSRVTPPQNYVDFFDKVWNLIRQK